MIRSAMCIAARDKLVACRLSVYRLVVRRLPLSILAAATLMTTATGQNVREKTIMRVFWQDAASQKLSYANLTASSRWNLRRGWVGGFPQLDASTQSLGEMVAADGQVFVSVTAASDAAVGGWLCLDSGAFEEPHGNHTHWKYTRTPKVRQSELTVGRGQVSGLKQHGDTVVHADSTGACTLLTPGQMKFGGDRGIRRVTLPEPAPFCMLDGQTLITVGEKAGQIVTRNYRLTDPLTSRTETAFEGGRLSGVVHNSQATFLSCDGGINRLTTNSSGVVTPSTQINEPVSGLTSHLQWVLGTAGTGEDARLCLKNATQSASAITQLPIPGPEGTRPLVPRVTLSLGKRFAFVIQQATSPDVGVQEQLTVILLDPNKDKDFSDARIHRTIDLGTQLAAKAAARDICFDAYGRHAVLTSPAEGVMTVISLSKMNIVARFRVGGAPGRIVSVGAAEHFH
ncbi:MAG: hypothetical protein NXI04_10485 [Planctomycetaceae bacterium]|nr:hypothetical protein [Planctomycetaceae bacterium]